jgi:hypothetical protein
MYKRTDPQRSLFSVDSQLSDSLKARLKGSWAELFREAVLPILLQSEDRFACLYGKTGRPNFSVARMVGLCLLQELNDLSDQQALDTFGFDIRWRHALDVSQDEAYLSRRSLVEFRRRLASQDPDMSLIRGIFENISQQAIDRLGISTRDQRVDSTHIVSNICTRGRLDLFTKTIRFFLKSLDQRRFKRIPRHIAKWYQVEPDGWFGGGKVEKSIKLGKLAKYLYQLITRYKTDPAVKSSESYQLLERLFAEQCEIIEKPGKGKSRGPKKVRVKRRTKGIGLQSPHDPEASYGLKGCGYSAHVTETCNNKDKSEIITDYEVHGAGRSDKGKATAIVERLKSSGLKPKALYADGGYPSAPSALKITEKSVEFMTPVDRARLSDEVIGRDQFGFDANGLLLKCPMGQAPKDHRMRSANNQKGKSLHAIFNGDICRACKKLEKCPVRAPNNRKRGCHYRKTTGDFRLEITSALRLRDKMYADQQTDQWKDRYKIRSGIEATMSELKRSHGFGKLRVRRIAKVSFAVACKVIACNIKRWAKVHKEPNGPSGRLLLQIFGLLIEIVSELVEMGSIQRRTKTVQFCFS